MKIGVPQTLTQLSLKATPLPSFCVCVHGHVVPQTHKAFSSVVHNTQLKPLFVLESLSQSTPQCIRWQHTLTAELELSKDTLQKHTHMHTYRNPLILYFTAKNIHCAINAFPERLLHCWSGNLQYVCPRKLVYIYVFVYLFQQNSLNTVVL